MLNLAFFSKQSVTFTNMHFLYMSHTIPFGPCYTLLVFNVTFKPSHLSTITSWNFFHHELVNFNMISYSRKFSPGQHFAKSSIVVLHKIFAGFIFVHSQIFAQKNVAQLLYHCFHWRTCQSWHVSSLSLI